MTLSLDKLTIRGFKSIRELEGLELKNLNILIGANGSGKSNLIALLQMMKAQADGYLRSYLNLNCGLKDLLHKGSNPASKVEIEAGFGECLYRLNLVPGAGDSYDVIESVPISTPGTGQGSQETALQENESLAVGEEEGSYSSDDKLKAIHETISSWRFYHFHETGTHAAMRHSEIIQDNAYLRPDASNIAPFLLRLRDEHPFEYQEILSISNLAAPFLEDFLLKPEQMGPKTKVSLTWKAKNTDAPMQAYHLSDGTIRFICLATALLQPNLPPLIILDEPELGLHPTASHMLEELIHAAARQTQVILATQSTLLLEECAIEDVILVNRGDGQSTFMNLTDDGYKTWLEEHTVGGLWWKNVIPGDIQYE